jgi:hypothetical protein
MESLPVKLESQAAIGLLYNDASKTISDLKSRQWTATTLAVAAIIGIDTYAHGCPPRLPHLYPMALIGAIVVGYIWVMWRCISNLATFRARMRLIIKACFPDDVRALSMGDNQDLFKDQREFSDAIVDEGTIQNIALVVVFLAFLFVLADIWSMK